MEQGDDMAVLEPAASGRPPRRWLSRRRIAKEIDDLRARRLSEAEERQALLALLKEALAEDRQAIRAALVANDLGHKSARDYSDLVDQLVRIIHDYAARYLFPAANLSSGERMAIVAVGGYGRREMAPFSDVDLLFLTPSKKVPRVDQLVESLLYFLWDLGFKVGHATRTIDDSLRQAKRDHTIATNLLDARYIWGDQALALEFKRRYRAQRQSDDAAKFIEAKLTERAERHTRAGGSRYSLEPHIKDGKGGLRDLHTLLWIAEYAFDVTGIEELHAQGLLTRGELRRYLKARDFLWTLRFHLHYAAGRAEERLTFDLQVEIAGAMGYRRHAGTQPVERLMKHYFLVAKDVGTLTRLVCAELESRYARRGRFSLPALLKRSVEGFPVKASRITVPAASTFREQPIEMLRIFRVAQVEGVDIHPEALRWIRLNLKRIDHDLRDDPAANALFLDILCDPAGVETALRRMNETGVLGRFIPDFGRVVSQMQFNMYHHYTVDEHLIFAVGRIAKIESGELAEIAPIASKVIHKVLSRRVLYVAILLHDIAKGRGGDHSELGAEVAERLCPRLGLTDEETETVAWLVTQHLRMSDVAFKRDLDDPRTIRDFADLVQSMERLRLLLVLTVADIQAVGPGTWTPWKAALLRDLYWRTEELLTGGHAHEGREKRVRAAQEAMASGLPGWSQADIQAQWDLGYPSYWLSFDSDAHIRHAILMKEAATLGLPLSISSRIDRYRDVSELIVYTPDHAGLFSRIAGALSAAGAEIEHAKIFTMANGMALDVFYLRDRQTHGAFERPDRLARLSSYIERTLTGDLKPWDELKEQRLRELPSRFDVFTVQPRVLIDNAASNEHTVVEVNGRDRPGLLHDLTFALTRLNLIINAAVVTTYGERVVDSFYVRDVLGGKIEDPERLRILRLRLKAAITSGETALESDAA